MRALRTLIDDRLMCDVRLWFTELITRISTSFHWCCDLSTTTGLLDLKYWLYIAIRRRCHLLKNSHNVAQRFFESSYYLLVYWVMTVPRISHNPHRVGPLPNWNLQSIWPITSLGYPSRGMVYEGSDCMPIRMENDAPQKLPEPEHCDGNLRLILG